MDREWTIRTVSRGYVIDGISYGPQPLALIAENESTIVLCAPGHSWNASGIRGMRDMRYAPATMIVAEIIQRGIVTMRVRPLIQWKPAEVQAKRRRAKAEART